MKLLRASAVEAVSEFQAGKKFAPVSSEDLRAVFTDAESGKADVNDLTARTEIVTKETPKSVMFETRDRGQSGAWVHRNYLTK
jgi:hypothetical protein